MSINTEAQKDPSQLEREVDERRNHMGSTLSALEEKLTPSHFFDEIVSYARRNGGEFSQNLASTVKSNPLPTLLTAVGITWLMYGHSTSSSDTSGGGSTYNSNSDSGSDNQKMDIKERGAQLKDSVSRSVNEAKHKAADTADSLRHQTQRARAGLTHLLEQQPLAVGALGIALGALLGGALPATRKEDELMGESSDDVVEKATQTVKETYEKAADISKKVAQDTKQEVRVAAEAEY